MKSYLNTVSSLGQKLLTHLCANRRPKYPAQYLIVLVFVLVKQQQSKTAGSVYPTFSLLYITSKSVG